MRQLKERMPAVSGLQRLWRVDEATGLITPLAAHSNQIQFNWGWAACQLFGRGNGKYKIGGMYIEFENVADPADPVSVPDVERQDGVEYYDDLLGSGVRDYLRVATREPTIAIGEGYEAYFEEGVTGNKLILMAQTSGTTGVNGLTFSDSVNSKVFGVAAVATPVFSDRTQDVVIARSYYDSGDQHVKEASAQIMVTWELLFG